jgi:hypothetical protein
VFKCKGLWNNSRGFLNDFLRRFKSRTNNPKEREKENNKNNA